MNYVKPDAVLCPANMVSNVTVLFDGGDKGFSIADVVWDGNHVLAMRYNSSHSEQQDSDKISGKKICKGFPFSSANSVWFILPPEIFDSTTEPGKAIQEYLKAYKLKSDIWR